MTDPVKILNKLTALQDAASEAPSMCGNPSDTSWSSGVAHGIQKAIDVVRKELEVME